MAIKLDDANRMIQGAIAKAEELGIKVTVAVCDAGGRLVSLNRMDGAIWAAVFGSQGKAAASAAFNRPSGLMEPQAESPALKSIIAAIGQNVILRQGAVPLKVDGLVVAACGVGGGTSQQDEECAQAGVDAVSSS